LACTNHPPTTTHCPQSLQNLKMPPFKGPEWEHVVILEQKGQNYKMESKYCKLKFSGGAPRIRKHFIRRNSSVGVAACKSDPAAIEDLVAAMAEINDAQKEKEQHATKKRQLDRNTASMSAASVAAASTQLTMYSRGLGSPSRGLWGAWGCKIY